MSPKNLSRRALMAGAPMAAVAALPLPQPAAAAPAPGAVSFPALLAQFMPVRDRWLSKNARDEAHAAIRADLFYKASGMTNEERLAMDPSDPRFDQMHALFMQVMDEVQSGDPVDKHGADIEWNEIFDEFYPLADAILSQPAQSIADLAWQAEVLVMSDCQLTEDSNDPTHWRTYKLVENIRLLSGNVAGRPYP